MYIGFVLYKNKQNKMSEIKKRKSLLVSHELHRALDKKRGELGLRTFTDLLLYLLTMANKNKK